MCGIVGFCDFTKKLGEENLVALTNALSHRGPDASGHELIRNDHAVIGIGNRRLSIIDLSSHGHQPFISKDKNLILTFNGTIYNYVELREELRTKGYEFTSGSDTEVLLYAYAEWKTEVIHKLDGIFAFVLFDRQQNKLFFARDKAGVKPFYYLYDQDYFIFSSEVRAFHHLPFYKKNIRKEALNYFFQLGYVPSPLSVFEGIYKLPPAYFGELLISENRFYIEKYWSVEGEEKELHKKDESELIEELDALYDHAANKRLIGDKEVGVLMSGGYDSTLLAALLQKEQQIKTITVGFADTDYNEIPNAEAIANHLGTRHFSVVCTPGQTTEIVKLLPDIFDEPVSDSGAIPQVLAFRAAKQQGLSLILSADGNDELFHGYEKYNRIKNLQRKIKRIPSPIRKILAAAIIFLPIAKKNKIVSILRDSSSVNIHFQMISVFTPDEMKLLFREPIYQPIKESLYKNANIYNNDFRYYMTEHILTGVDKVSMWYGIESREPFLDKNIIHFAVNLPEHLKQRNGKLKYIVKQVAHRYIPEKLLDQPKKGFSAPIAELLRNELKETVIKKLSAEKISVHSIFNNSFVNEILSKFFDKNDNSYAEKVWALFTFQCWYERWMI
jgi:asparagine synthase (glutamine-hydrolysing)